MLEGPPWGASWSWGFTPPRGDPWRYARRDMVERGGADPLSRRLLCRRIHAVHADGYPM